MIKYYKDSLGWLLRVDTFRGDYKVYQYHRWLECGYYTRNEIKHWKEISESDLMLELL